MAGDFKDVFGGASGGALAGAPFGPWGAAAGGALGGLTGLLFGSGKEKSNLEDAFRQVSSRYAGYRPEDFARRKLAIQQAMSMMDPARSALSAMGGGAPMTDYNAFFQPPQSPGRLGPQPRTNPALNLRGLPSGIQGLPSGTAATGPAGPVGNAPWRGRAT